MTVVLFALLIKAEQNQVVDFVRECEPSRSSIRLSASRLSLLSDLFLTIFCTYHLAVFLAPFMTVC